MRTCKQPMAKYQGLLTLKSGYRFGWPNYRAGLVGALHVHIQVAHS